ncbi:MAG: hypothetical protein WD844_10265 [Thermoleophilaceae bacterium]
MTEILDHPRGQEFLLPPPPATEAPARRSLLGQIARIESELCSLFCSAYPHQGFDWGVPSRGGPRILSLGELEALRDDLAERLEHTRRALCDRTYAEDLQRRRIEEMMLDPAGHKWERVRNEDIGERGCKEYRVVPRLGLIGMLAGWWHVKISSGCPLAT